MTKKLKIKFKKYLKISISVLIKTGFRTELFLDVVVSEGQLQLSSGVFTPSARLVLR